MDIETGEDLRWYLVHTKPRQEERANSNLMAWGVETLYAKLRTRCRYNQFTGVPTYIPEPLFPRYVLAKFNARQLPKIRFTRGVHGLVYLGNSPARVCEEIITIIRARIDQNGFVKGSSDLKPGDRAVISEGPLRKLMEVFEREIKGSERSIILLRAVDETQ